MTGAIGTRQRPRLLCSVNIPGIQTLAYGYVNIHTKLSEDLRMIYKQIHSEVYLNQPETTIGSTFTSTMLKDHLLDFVTEDTSVA